MAKKAATPVPVPRQPVKAAPTPVQRQPAPAAARAAVDPNAIKAGHIMTNADRAKFDAMRKKDPARANAFKAGLVGVGGALGSPDLNAGSNMIGGMGQDLVKQGLGGDWSSFEPNLTPRGDYQEFNPDLTPRTGTGDLVADRQRIEDEVFNRLTRGADEQFKRSDQDKAQELHDRGIPMGSKQYQDEMDRYEKNKANYYLDARANATQLGGQEYERSFGIGEQTRANDYSQQYGRYGMNRDTVEGRRQNEFGEQIGARNQRLGEMDQFYKYGNQPIQNDFQRQQIELQRRQANAAINQLRGKKSGGDGRVHGYGGQGPTGADYGDGITFY